MNRRLKEKARRVLKKLLILGGAMLFVAAVAGCDQSDAVKAASDPSVGSSQKADARSGININGCGGYWWGW